jgi:hypothetical protein
MFTWQQTFVYYYSESVTYMLPEEEPTAIPTGDKRTILVDMIDLSDL